MAEVAVTDARTRCELRDLRETPSCSLAVRSSANALGLIGGEYATTVLCAESFLKNTASRVRRLALGATISAGSSARTPRGTSAPSASRGYIRLPSPSKR